MSDNKALTVVFICISVVSESVDCFSCHSNVEYEWLQKFPEKFF